MDTCEVQAIITRKQTVIRTQNNAIHNLIHIIKLGGHIIA